MKTLIAFLILGSAAAFGQTCTQTFTTATYGTNGANVAAAIGSGNSSTVLCLSSGSYGNLIVSGRNPTGIVTLKPSPSSSGSIGELQISSSKNLLMEGFGCTVGVWTNYGGAASCTGNGWTSGGVTTSGGGVTNLQMSYNAFSAQGAEIRDNSANANIVLDHNTYSTNFGAACETCRIHIFNNGTPMGVTISFSYMANGDDDGIQWGGSGLQLLNNEFFNLTGNAAGIHQDAMQGVGDDHSVVKGNYAHAVANCWQLTDGTSNLDLENNICVADGSDGHSGQICSITATLKHNTIASAFDINVGKDSNGASSSNWTDTDSIYNGELAVNSGQPITGINIHNFNLCFTGTACNNGANGRTGTPTFTGGANPTTQAGYQLTAGSIGHAAADDGLDMGVIFSGSPSANTPSFSPVAGTYTGAQSVAISTTSGSVICYNTTGSPATNGTTGCTTGTLYVGPVTVSVSQTLFAIAGGTGFVDSTVGSAAYVINPSLTMSGVSTMSGSAVMQ